MTRPVPGDTPSHDDRSTLIDHLDEVRAELDQLVGARMLKAFTPEQSHRYQELGEQERDLLLALAPCIPERRQLS